MEAERFYGSLGAPAVFRLSPLAGPDTDRILEELGYRVLDETIVMTTPLAGAAAMEETVSIERHCAGGWESGYADAHVLAASERRAHRAILDRIAPLKTAFATATVDGRAVAFGLGVVERDRLGLFDIVTMPEARRLRRGASARERADGLGRSRGCDDGVAQRHRRQRKSEAALRAIGFPRAVSLSLSRGGLDF